MKGRYLEPIIVPPGAGSSTGTADPETVLRSELGTAAYANIGSATGEVAAGDHSHPHTHTVIAQYAVPDVLTVAVGTLDSGNVTTLATKDGTDVAVSEVVGTPGFNIELEFHDVVSLEMFEFFGRYSGSSTHFIGCEVYFPGSATWENYGSFGTSAVAQWYRFPIIDGDEHIDGSGTVKIRLYHIQAGNAAHDMYIDFARIRTGFVAQSAL